MYVPGGAFGYPPEIFTFTAADSARGKPSKFTRHNIHWELPLIAVGMLAALFIFLTLRGTPDQIESFVLNQPYLLKATWEHLGLSITAALIAAFIGIPLGIVLAHSTRRWVVSLAVALANIGQATPALGVLVLLALVLGVGPSTALIALVIYCLLPVLRNTLTGIREIDPNILTAAQGMGMTTFQQMVRIELPLSANPIVSGFRTALVFSIGVATLATFVNAGGLGEAIVIGVKLNRLAVLMTGAVLVSALVLLLDWIVGLIGIALSPRGLES